MGGSRTGAASQRLDTLHIADSLAKDWSFTPEMDQQTAGLLFWIGAAAVFLTEVMLVYYLWYISPEVQNERPLAQRPIE